MSDPTPTPDKKGNDALRKVTPEKEENDTAEDATILLSLDTTCPVDDLIKDLVKVKNLLVVAEVLGLSIDDDAGATGTSGKDVEIFVPTEKLEDFLKRFVKLGKNAPDDINIQVFSEEQREIADRFETEMNHFHGEKRVYIDEEIEEDDEKDARGTHYGSDPHDGYGDASEYSGISE